MIVLVIMVTHTAKQTSCLCPTDKFSPPSDTSNSSPFSKLLANDFKWACSSASQTSSSVYTLNGSMFIRSVPENSTGSCGIMVRRERSDCRPSSDISTPSMVIFPSAASMILQWGNHSILGHSHYQKIFLYLNKARVKLDLPAPVRPTMPTFSPPLISNETPFSTRSKFSLYFTL